MARQSTSVWLSDYERKALGVLAQLEQRSLSGVIREMVRQRVADLGIHPYNIDAKIEEFGFSPEEVERIN